eukprot:PITA_30907
MRVFGCVVYTHVPDELRNKLDNKREKCIFVGYSDESKSYKLYNPLTEKVIIKRDGQFIEEEAWDGSLEKAVNDKQCIPHEDKEELTATNNPIHFEDGVKEEKWGTAMEEEIEAIERNDTWELVNLPKGKHVIGVKWVYNTKSNIERKIERHKARLIVKGYKQQHGRDYTKMFTPIMRMERVHVVVVISAQHKWRVYRMDVKTTFLNGVLKK